jgi:hypothetical protein
MAIVDPALLKLIGDGFAADAYAADGVHLRWHFDRRLGFPRFGFCVDRRPAVGDKKSAPRPRSERFAVAADEAAWGIQRSGLMVRHEEGTALQLGTEGVALGEVPLLVDFHAGSVPDKDPAACWVRLHLRAQARVSFADAEARYRFRGEDEAVDRGRFATPGSRWGPRRIADLPLIRRFAPAVPPVDGTIELRADQIDRVALAGSRAWLLGIEWVTRGELLRSESWERVNCYAMATGEKDYVEDNAKTIAGRDHRQRTKEIVMDPLPHGAEPLDEPVVPPLRPPTAKEREDRYLRPWLEQLEPWLARLLSESQGGGRHQSEIETTEELDTLHHSGEPVPERLSGMTTTTIRPYQLLLASSTSFPVARLLALACVDAGDEGRRWDYRVRGRWDIRDVTAWRDACERRFQRALHALGEATPAEWPERVAELLAAQADAAAAASFVESIGAAAGHGFLEIDALAMGVRAGPHELFAGPASLSAALDSLGPPDPVSELPEEAIARLRWPLRSRGHVVADEAVPVGAAAARAVGGQLFDTILNARHPDYEVAMPLLPGSEEEGWILDRAVADGVGYRYGVSEVDPFGRWSRFTETTFAWEDTTPPDVPMAVEAELHEQGTPPQLALELRFSWRPDRFDPAEHEFAVGVRRSSESTLSRSPGDWARCSRTPAGAAPAYVFAADPAVPAPADHDGMTCSVTSSERVDASTGVARRFIDYVVMLDGLEVPRDSLGAAVAWVGVTARRQGMPSRRSPEVGGPARAEQLRAEPPAAPSLPPVAEATYADALGTSSYTLEWAGLADVRYAVLRAGEHELLDRFDGPARAAAGYREDDPPGQRAQALRSLAAHPQARAAFQPRADAIPPPPPVDPSSPLGHLPQRDWDVAAGPRSFTDELPGRLRTLVVYAVLGHNAAGVLSDWPSAPDSFVVVRVPQAPMPARPVVVGGEWRPPPEPPGARVELRIAAPPAATAPIRRLEVFRTLDPAKAVDVHLMRPLHRLQAPVFTAPNDGEEAVARFVDPGVEPWRTYYYRVVARAEQNGSAGTPSEPSAPVTVRTLSVDPPPPPVPLTATKTGDTVRVTFTAIVPETTFGESRFEVLHDQDGELVPINRSSEGQARQADGSFAISIEEPPPPSPQQVGPGSLLSVRVRDPAGNVSISAPIAVT